MNQGIIFDVRKLKDQSDSTNKVVVFFKGCPLDCVYCHNFEGKSPKQEIIVRIEKCKSCGNCLKECSNSAIIENNGIFLTKSEKCDLCLECVSLCPSQAREVSGTKLSIDRLIKSIIDNLEDFTRTNGNVIFSGGEPLMQPDFLLKALDFCQLKGISTTVETCGFTSIDVLLKLSTCVDLFLYDLKIYDDNKHKSLTGISNKIILDNLKELSKHHKNIIIRFQLIPSINDDEENIIKIAELIASLRLRGIKILPFRNKNVEKYYSIRKNRLPLQDEPPSEQQVNNLVSKLKNMGLNVSIEEYRG